MSQGWSAQDQVSQALRAVIADFGSQVLGNADMLGNLLKDHIPDHPREINVLQAAAQSGAAAAVDDRIRSGMAPAAAVRMTASELTHSLAIDSAAAEWGVAEFARALGYTLEPAATAPLADVTQLPGSPPADPQFGATIAAPVPPYAGQPTVGYSPPQQQQFYPAPQPTSAGPKSRRPLIVAVCAVLVLAAAIGGIVAFKSGPVLTGAKCLVGSWTLQSAHEDYGAFGGFQAEQWSFTAGSEQWRYSSTGTGTTKDSGFTLSTPSGASPSGRVVWNDAGTFHYRVAGEMIKYSGMSAPGWDTVYNLTTGSKRTFNERSVYTDYPDHFSCSGNTLRRYGDKYSYTYSRS